MTINKVHDLTNYRQSRVIVKELNELRKELRRSYIALNKYRKYLPVRPILEEIFGAEVILKLFEKQHREIVRKKGAL